MVEGPVAAAFKEDLAIAVTVTELPEAVAATGAPLALNAVARAVASPWSVLPPL